MHCFKVFREIVYKGHEVKFTQSDYHKLFYRQIIYDPSVDILFDKYRDQFLTTPIRNWPDKIKEFSTSFSIKDSTSVHSYLQTLQSKYS